MRSDRKRRLSLRGRVTLALASLVAVFVFVFGIMAVVSLREQEDDMADAWVLSEATRLAAHVERGALRDDDDADRFTPTSTLRAWLVSPAGAVLPGPMPAYLQGLSEGLHWRTSADAELHIAVLPTSRGRLVVQYDASAAEEKVREFATYTTVLAALCAVIALLVSRRIASIVMGPMERLTAQLAGWAPDDTGAKEAPGDESERLFDAFQRVQKRFEAMVARQREFVANVRHEIKTPLSALRTDLELLLLDARADPARLPRLQRALSMVDAVNAALESASVVSAYAAAAAQEVGVASCVDDAWASLHDDVGIDRLHFVNAVPAAAVVRGDRHALLTILRNLIRNCAEHAVGARCVVSFAAGCIEVADDGPGIAAQDLPFVFERYYRGRYKDATGIEVSDRGIGLAIARQVADFNGWSLSVHSEPGTGTRFVLRLLASARASG